MAARPPAAGAAPLSPAPSDPALAPEIAAVAEPTVAHELVDPYGIGKTVNRLSSGSLRSGRVALGILTAMLEEDEEVDALVQGMYQTYMAVAALTSRRVLIANDHEWVPDVRSIPLTRDVVVQGWQDDRAASLTFIADGKAVTVSLINDRPLAQDFAHRMRESVAALGR
jgi:hypothetical protein